MNNQSLGLGVKLPDIEIKSAKGTRIDETDFKTAIDECIKAVPSGEKEKLPKVLLTKHNFFFIGNSNFFFINFIDKDELQRILSLKDKNFFPFPGLIKPDNIEMSAAL